MGDRIIHIDTERSDRFYRRMRQRVIDWMEDRQRGKYADLVLLAPDLFILLTRLLLDKRVAARDRAIVAGAVLYFMTPVDLIPDIFFPVGIVDDILVAAIALNNILNRTDPAIIREHWEGNDDILLVIQRVMQQADKILGSGALSTARKALKRRTPRTKD